MEEDDEPADDDELDDDEDEDDEEDDELDDDSDLAEPLSPEVLLEGDEDAGLLDDLAESDRESLR